MQTYALKFVMVGDSRVGKSQLSRSFNRREFLANPQSTVGMEFASRTIAFEKCNIKAQIWDTAGQERFESMTKAYYRDAVGAILVYDVSNRDSFEHLKSVWLNQLKEYGHENMRLILVGNKQDKVQDLAAKSPVRESEEHGGDHHESVPCAVSSEASAIRGDSGVVPSEADSSSAKQGSIDEINNSNNSNNSSSDSVGNNNNMSSSNENVNSNRNRDSGPPSAEKPLEDRASASASASSSTQEGVVTLMQRSSTASEKVVRQVSILEGKQFAEKLNIDFVETSALTGYCVELMFRRAVISVAKLLPEVRDNLELAGLPQGWVAVLIKNDKLASSSLSTDKHGDFVERGVDVDGNGDGETARAALTSSISHSNSGDSSTICRQHSTSTNTSLSTCPMGVSPSIAMFRGSTSSTVGGTRTISTVSTVSTVTTGTAPSRTTSSSTAVAGYSQQDFFRAEAGSSATEADRPALSSAAAPQQLRREEASAYVMEGGGGGMSISGGSAKSGSSLNKPLLPLDTISERPMNSVDSDLEASRSAQSTAVLAAAAKKKGEDACTAGMVRGEGEETSSSSAKTDPMTVGSSAPNSPILLTGTGTGTSPSSPSPPKGVHSFALAPITPPSAVVIPGSVAGTAPSVPASPGTPGGARGSRDSPSGAARSASMASGSGSTAEVVTVRYQNYWTGDFYPIGDGTPPREPADPQLIRTQLPVRKSRRMSSRRSSSGGGGSSSGKRGDRKRVPGERRSYSGDDIDSGSRMSDGSRSSLGSELASTERSSTSTQSFTLGHKEEEDEKTKQRRRRSCCVIT